MFKILIAVLIPFAGTTLGAFMVFFMKDKINAKTEKIMLGFASGVMISASVWSLILPAISWSQDLGKWSFVPAVSGIILGMLFLGLLNFATKKLQAKTNSSSLAKHNHKKFMLVLAIALHNIPEGMAVGVALAGAYFGGTGITLAGAIALSVGIAIQNLPEGAIVSMPLKSSGMSKPKSFLCGVLSGVVEPIFAILTILLTKLITPVLPYILSFAGGAMITVVISELIPDSQTGENNSLATISFILGFVLMMALDVALG